MNVAAIILAAGASRRLGHPKQNILLGSETLLERSVRIATLADLRPVYLVLAPDHPPPDLAATILINPEAAEGMASSIRTGILATSTTGTQGVVILACDQPAVTPGHLRLLLAASEHNARIVVSAYAGRKGIPAFFPSSAFTSLLELRGDTGARALIASAHTIPLANGELDIDTPQDLARAQALFVTAIPR